MLNLPVPPKGLRVKAVLFRCCDYLPAVLQPQGLPAQRRDSLNPRQRWPQQRSAWCNRMWWGGLCFRRTAAGAGLPGAGLQFAIRCPAELREPPAPALALLRACTCRLSPHTLQTQAWEPCPPVGPCAPAARRGQAGATPPSPLLGWPCLSLWSRGSCWGSLSMPDERHLNIHQQQMMCNASTQWNSAQRRGEAAAPPCDTDAWPSKYCTEKPDAGCFPLHTQTAATRDSRPRRPGQRSCGGSGACNKQS